MNDLKLAHEIDKAEIKAIKALAGYKFAMFGYWAGIWVHLNKIEGKKRPSPFKSLVHAARDLPVDHGGRAIETVESTQDRGGPTMVAPPADVEKHGTGIRYQYGQRRPKIRRTIRLPTTDVKVVVDLGIDINGYPIMFIDTDNVPIVENEVEVLVYINNGTAPRIGDRTRYTALREVGR
jgi:hypothetical protein